MGLFLVDYTHDRIRPMLPDHKILLETLNIQSPQLLGSGMEGYVYDYFDDKVIKIWRDKHAKINQLQERQQLYEMLADQMQIYIPEIYEIGTVDSKTYTVEKKLFGKAGHVVYLTASEEVKIALLNNYFALLEELKKITISGKYGQILSSSMGKLQANTWTEFLGMKLAITKQEVITKPDHDIADIGKVFDYFFNSALPKLSKNPQKNLVHGDIFFENILADDKGSITGLLDFSSLTVIGDHIMDVTGLVYFACVTEGIGENVKKYLLEKAKQNYPDDFKMVDIYLAYYSLLFINSKSYDPRTYTWCVNNLKKLGYL
ncbi:MAG: hypothetical protein BroJett025_05950 [Patescibacteria group bacterium]|nr:MAG: hypothetical protein BroJett025_05950 [Patescibacteria group bacterium]